MSVKKHNRNCCDGCRQNWNKVSAGPMLCDGTWRRLADKSETLCGDCILARSIKRQVPITLADLKPCPFNLFGWPQSWFNLFASIARPPTVVSAKWRDAAAGGSPRWAPPLPRRPVQIELFPPVRGKGKNQKITSPPETQG